MEDQRMLHWFISNEFDLTGSPVMSPIVQAIVEVTEPMVDPLDTNYGQPENQTNLLVQIAEVTGDESALAAQYPVTEEESIAPIDEVMHYEDPAGNTFEAPVVEEKPRLSLDDILIRIPNEEKKKAEAEIEEAEIATAIERVERKELKETLKAEEQKGKLPSDIQSRLDAFNAKREAESSILTPEEIEDEYDLKHTDDYQDVIEQKAEELLEVEAVNTTENQPSTFNDFEFDLGSNDDEDVTFDADFL
jgi:hypothetical protein